MLCVDRSEERRVGKECSARGSAAPSGGGGGGGGGGDCFFFFPV